LVEGYACALWRLNNSSWGGGGGVSISNSGSGLTEEVDVTVQYPQPMFIPGMASMWNFVAGDTFSTSISPLGKGLGGIAGMSASALNDYNSVSSELSGLGFNMPALPPQLSMESYVNVQSKCAIGYESWGSNTTWRPRIENTVTDAGTDPSTSSQLSNASQDATNASQASSAYSNALQQVTQDCNNLSNAVNQLASDKSALAAAQNANPQNSLQIQQLKAQVQLDNETVVQDQGTYNTDLGSFETARQNLSTAAGGGNMPDYSCPASGGGGG
jgi:hypothetical protein